MKPALSLAKPLPLERTEERYLGPAHVVDGDARAVRVRLPTGEVVVAELALALAYEPAKDDIVLVIGERGAHYGIGVLRGKGRLVLETEGDIAIRAKGALDLSGASVRVSGKQIEVQSSRLTMVAEALTQRVGSFLQRVTGILTVHAKQSHTVVEESAVTQAKNATILTEDSVNINGKSVLLG